MILELLLTASFFAQSHPCDDVLAVNPSLASPVRVGFCAVDPSVASVKVFVDGAVTWTGMPTRVTSGTNIEGLYYYETPNLTIPKGTHVAQADITNGAVVMEPGYQFTIVAPGQAKRPRIIK
jgi:hypothetical protein